MVESGKPPTNPFVPTTPTSISLSSQTADSPSNTRTPARSRISAISPSLLRWQSWFPSTAITGTSSDRQTSASTSAAAGGQVAREHDHVGLGRRPFERLVQLRRVVDGRVDVPRGGDLDHLHILGVTTAEVSGKRSLGYRTAACHAETSRS